MDTDAASTQGEMKSREGKKRAWIDWNWQFFQEIHMRFSDRVFPSVSPRLVGLHNSATGPRDSSLVGHIDE
jgi:hypothetical protein